MGRSDGRVDEKTQHRKLQKPDADYTDFTELIGYFAFVRVDEKLQHRKLQEALTRILRILRS